MMLLLSLAAIFSFHWTSVSAFALPWIVTTYVEIITTTIITPTTYIDISVTEKGLFETNIIAISPTAASIHTLSVVTTIDEYNSQLTWVEVLLPTGVGSTVTNDAGLNPTTYYVQLYYTAPSSCSSRWVYSTKAYLDVPYQVEPTPTSVSTILTQPKAFGPTNTEFIAFLNPTDIPADAFSSLSSRDAPFFKSSCSVPYDYTATGTSPGAGAAATSASGSSGSSSSGSSSANNWEGCDPFVWYFAGAQMGQGYICDDGIHYTQGISITNFVLIWIFTWLGFFLICGLIESYIKFSALACGRKAGRGLPFSFACMFPLLSCFFLCFSKRRYAAKSLEEQRLLKEQWQKTPFFTRIGYWLRWGFRYKYPPFLGSAPPRHHWGEESTTTRRPPPRLIFNAEPPVSNNIVAAEMEQPHRFHEMQSPSEQHYELPSPDLVQGNDKAQFGIMEKRA